MATEETMVCPNCDTELLESEVVKTKKCKKCKVEFELEFEGANAEADTEDSTKVEDKPNEQTKTQTQGEEMTETQTKETTKTPKRTKTAASAAAAQLTENSIDVVRKVLNGKEHIKEVVHDTYVSWYKNGDGTKKGDRFLVAYRHGRNIKVQFFDGDKKVDHNPNVHQLIAGAKTGFEYKSRDLDDFKQLIESTY